MFEKLGETRADADAVTVRIADVEGGTPTIEFSFQGTANVKGIDVGVIGTYVARPRRDGSLVGQGRGVVMTPDGEAITWHATGIGKPTGRGSAAKWKTAFIYEPSEGKLASLAEAPVLGEFDIDERGGFVGRLQLWK